MIQFRKVIIFLFVLILFIYMIRTSYSAKKKWNNKRYFYTLLMLNGGLGFLLIATFLDMITIYIQYQFIYAAIKVFFTLGGVIFAMGLIKWTDFTWEIMNKLEMMALMDSMTGVLNRNGLDIISDAALKVKKPFYVIVCDLDGTKRINDSFGHIEGDNYISKAAKIISSTTGSKGHLARIGGDEFVIILDYIEKTELNGMISRIKKQICEINPNKSTGISLGCALFPTDGTSFMELYKTADKLMYDDKKA
ncbi:MAG: GGDEF domain-containing protein [Bacillota bacterium]|nr:GGDEF domain-containing protein [Bacillota bacterium]